MITTFVVILVNIVLGTIFYLVISLKLEKKASEYYSKKFKTEIDDMIREFNSTADRNISILENKISAMKRLMDKDSSVNKVSIDIKDEETNNNPPVENIRLEKDFKTNSSSNTEPQNNIVESIIEKGYNFINKLKSSVSKKENVKNSKYDIVKEIEDNTEKKQRNFEFMVDEKVYPEYNPEKESHDVTIENIKTNASQKNDNSIDEMNEDKIRELFLNTGNKHHLLTKLFKEGYPVELLSKCSDIPSGEIKLVVNLNNTQ